MTQIYEQECPYCRKVVSKSAGCKHCTRLKIDPWGAIDLIIFQRDPTKPIPRVREYYDPDVIYETIIRMV